ncbi:hypothetical protein CTAYLR_008303 [Chrysophaeum taylorii]|uniref:HECT-type E3 ubiquitin transferase n=1 Tax=Chrysophaeum taylorii TaxID=2483200 RepID=A0AAD7XK54_9STRA|nr:hypothetical protein CTAYLR_008303 [Chrysophaeum taylorii]
MITTSLVFDGPLALADFGGAERRAFRVAISRELSVVTDAHQIQSVRATEIRSSGDAARRRLVEQQRQHLKVEFRCDWPLDRAADELDAEASEIGDAYKQELKAAIIDRTLESSIRNANNGTTNMSAAVVNVDLSTSSVEEETLVAVGFGGFPLVVVQATAAPTVGEKDEKEEEETIGGGGRRESSTLEAVVIISLVTSLGVGTCAVSAVLVARRQQERAKVVSRDAMEEIEEMPRDNGDVEGDVEDDGMDLEIFDDDDDYDDRKEDTDDADGGELRTCETYQARARYRRIEYDDVERRRGRVSWHNCTEKHGPRFVRRFGASRLELAAADAGVALPWRPASDELRRMLTRSAPFEERSPAFRRAADALRIHWTVGRVEFSVKRDRVFETALEALGAMPATHWRRPFFVKFEDESGLDAGGLSREFFALASLEALADASGYFRACYGTYHLRDDDDDDDESEEDEVSSVRAAAEREQRLVFIGRLMGKCLLEGHHFAARPSIVMLKHACCEPVAFEDLQLLDFELWKSLSMLPMMPKCVLESLDLSFSLETVRRGRVATVELCPGGASRSVTSANVEEFLELRFRQRVLDACRRGLSAVLRGVYSVVPLDALLLLTGRELELTLCGVPEISVDEWRRCTVYNGVFAELGARHPVIENFWGVVAGWDDRKRATLLQWATGSSCCPIGGLAQLQGRDGALRPFTLTSVELSQAAYPKSHTCFNRIDLPLYRTRADLRAALDFVLTNAAAFSRFSID